MPLAAPKPGAPAAQFEALPGAESDATSPILASDASAPRAAQMGHQLQVWLKV